MPGAISGCSIPAHPAPCYTTVNGINESGRLVGIYQDQAGQFHAFLFSCTAGDLSACPGSSFTTLDPAGAIYSQGGFINSQGQVVGSYITSDQKWHGFIWQSGSFISPINVPNDHPELGTVLFGINDRGQIVGSYVDMGPPAPAPHHRVRHAIFRDTAGNFTQLDTQLDPPTGVALLPKGSTRTVAEGINNRGEIAGWYVDQNNLFHGFVLSGVGDHTDPSAWTTIDVLHNTFIYSINARGQIAGQYDDDAGHTHGFVGTPEQ